MKNSTVISAIFKKEYEGQYGKMFIHEITFDNGDKGDYLSKVQHQDKFKEGQVADYELSSREHNGNTYYSVKPVQKTEWKQGTGGGNKSHALTNAVRLVCSGKIGMEQLKEVYTKFLNEYL